VRAMADIEGISFLRTTRADTTVLYEPDEEFPVGGSRTVRSSDDDDVTIVAAGITLHEALAAADRLAEEGMSARVIDLYSVKPIDEETLRSIRTPIVTAEDHWAEGGIGEAVLSVLSEVDDRPQVRILAVREMPHSGKPAELLAAAGIDADHIAAAARELAATRAAV
jgi:transketolase